jgi:hypothetical protein
LFSILLHSPWSKDIIRLFWETLQISLEQPQCSWYKRTVTACLAWDPWLELICGPNASVITLVTFAASAYWPSWPAFWVIVESPEKIIVGEDSLAQFLPNNLQQLSSNHSGAKMVYRLTLRAVHWGARVGIEAAILQGSVGSSQYTGVGPLCRPYIEVALSKKWLVPWKVQLSINSTLAKRDEKCKIDLWRLHSLWATFFGIGASSWVHLCTKVRNPIRWRILFPRQIYSHSLQKHPFSASWTPKNSSPHHVHVRVGTYVQRLLLVERQKLWLGGST